jgi:hypothetical protein
LLLLMWKIVVAGPVVPVRQGTWNGRVPAGWKLGRLVLEILLSLCKVIPESNITRAWLLLGVVFFEKAGAPDA